MTITGGDYSVEVIKRATVLLRANVVTYLPMSGFKILVSMETPGHSDAKFVMDNVVIKKSPPRE